MHNDNLINAIENIRRFFITENSLKLRYLSNELIKDATLKNNKLLANVAIIAYCLHKIFTKEHILKSGFWIEYKMSSENSLSKSLDSLKGNDFPLFEKYLKSIAIDLEKLDKQTGRYLQSLIDKARIKYAADAYFMGLSLSKAAELTNANIDALQRYIGLTKQQDIGIDKKGIRRRLEELKSLLK